MTVRRASGEIADAVGYRSTGGLHYQLEVLKGLGDIDNQPNHPRAVKLPTNRISELSEDPAPYKEEAVMASVIGRIAAGTPILAHQNIEYVFPLPQLLIGLGNCFLLRVQGDSMINAAILDGNWVVVRQQDAADDGQTVAALIDNEATVKVLRHHAGQAWLMPCNAAYAPVPGDQASVLGVVVAVLRSLSPPALLNRA
jgi:repressor LexA